MTGYGLMKLGGTKLLGSIFTPGFAVLAFGGVVTWKILHDKKKNRDKTVKRNDDEYKKNVRVFKSKLDILTNEQRRLTDQVTKLQDVILKLRQVKPVSYKKSSLASGSINEKSKSTKDGRKLSILKGLIDDNIKLRTG